MMAIAEALLSRDNIQQLNVMLRRNTELQDLDLIGGRLRSAGLAEIASVCYQNTSVQDYAFRTIVLVDASTLSYSTIGIVIKVRMAYESYPTLYEETLLS